MLGGINPINQLICILQDVYVLIEYPTPEFIVETRSYSEDHHSNPWKHPLSLSCGWTKPLLIRCP
jgi:hypothetical protein